MPTATPAKRNARKGVASAATAVGDGATKRRPATAKSAREHAPSTRSPIGRASGSGVVARTATRREGPTRTATPAKALRAVASDFAFTTVLAERGPVGLWPHLFLTHEASRWLGNRGMANLIVNVNGAMFRRTARPDGIGGHFILFNAEMRERSGVEPGDRVRVGLEVDHAPGVVDTPRELEQALRSDPAARKAYSAMPPSHRRAYVQFIEEAKRPETRVRRIQQALRMMAQWAEERAAGKKR